MGLFDFGGNESGSGAGLLGGSTLPGQPTSEAMRLALLRAGLSLMSSPRGNFAQNLGQAGLQGMDAYGQAKQMERQQGMQDWQFQQMKLQAERAARDDARTQQLRMLPQQFMQQPMRPETMDNRDVGQPGEPQMPAAQFDQKGWLNARMAIDPEGTIPLLQKTGAESQFAKVNPGDYTPDSLQQFLQTGNHSVLRPRVKKEVVNGQVVDPYAMTPGTVLDTNDPNKPFALRGGQPVPNVPFQNYSANVARAGATKVQVDAGQRFENAYSTNQGKEFSDLMGTINRTGFAAPTQLRKLERMTQLLEGVDGGKLAPMGLEIASAANALGIKIDPRVGNKEAAQALSREIAGGFRQPGTGPMTDKDFDNFLLQVPDLSKTAEGRKQITATMSNALKRDMELSKRAREYERRNGRLDGGFLDEAAQFIAENPVVQGMANWHVVR